MTAKITGEGLSKSYEGRTILNHVNISVEKGRVYALMGRSGCGKTTLLRALCGLIHLDQGCISIDGEVVIQDGNFRFADWEIRRKVMYVAQTPSLLPHLNALQNLVLPLQVVLGWACEDASEIAVALANDLGLGKQTLTRYPEQLSGGECQRVQLLRAILLEPEILLLDEVTANIDPETTAEVLETLWKLKERSVKEQTIVITTHMISFAESFADKIGFLHSGRILEEGSAKSFARDANAVETQNFFRVARNNAAQMGFK